MPGRDRLDELRGPGSSAARSARRSAVCRSASVHETHASAVIKGKSSARSRRGLLRLASARTPPDSYRFGEFVISVRRRQLFRDGRSLPLIPRYFDLLVLLIERRPAVSRREIFDRVWSDVLVSDGALIVKILAHLGLPTNQFALASIPIRGQYIANIPVYHIRITAGLNCTALQSMPGPFRNLADPLEPHSESQQQFTSRP
jgi:DNA-binding winged helix-turn-helix (wHTH) protein